MTLTRSLLQALTNRFSWSASTKASASSDLPLPCEPLAEQASLTRLAMLLTLLTAAASQPSSDALCTSGSSLLQPGCWRSARQKAVRRLLMSIAALLHTLMHHDAAVNIWGALASDDEPMTAVLAAEAQPFAP